MYKIFSVALTCFALFSLILPALVDGQVRTSTNYQIERDSINIGGGLGTSTNYALESSVGEVATGRSTSTSYMIDAGYQQPENTYITISSPTDVSMSAINGLIGGTSTSSVSWTVTTNNSAGYSVTTQASTAPALASPLDAFDDYVPIGSDPDFSWSIAASTAEFGYSVSGVHTVQRFKDDGAVCNTGSGNVAEKCWDGFSVTPETIAQSASANAPTGSVTTLELRAEAGADRLLTADDYSANITVTAVAL